VYISGPALSQQIIALERELGSDLFVRDRRSVRLSEAGRSLLTDARRILALADDAKRRVVLAAARSSPVRLGYVSWLPDDVNTLVGSAVALRIDEWVLPSHTQADRVAEGTLDVALTWVTARHAAERGLATHLLRAEPLHSVVPSLASAEPVAAERLTVLVDADDSAWSSWNRFAEEFAAAIGARVVRIDDGGVAGDAFFVHVRRRARLAEASHGGGSAQPGAAPGVRSRAGVDLVAGTPRSRRAGQRARCRGSAAGRSPQSRLVDTARRAVVGPGRRPAPKRARFRVRPAVGSLAEHR
jgi:DNA-binding transcriptional LysR family regulator